MTKRFFDYDPLSGVVEWFVPSDDGESFQIVAEQEVSPTIDANRAQFNETNSARDAWGDGLEFSGRSHVAHIPAVIHADLIRRGIMADQDRLKAWLNEPDNAVFRTRPGTL